MPGMISQNPSLPGAFATSLFLLLASTLPGPAAEAGAWETFDTKDNADAWTVYDYSTDGYYYLNWLADGGDGYVYFWNEDDFPLWFFTDPAIIAGGGKLIGNYASQNIQSIIADVYIAAPVDLGALECAVFTTGPAGDDYYFSQAFTGADFPAGGWYTMRFGFDETWIHYGQAGPEPVTVDTQFLSNIKEIGFLYSPVTGGTVDHPFALDNVKLEPKVTPPVVSQALSNGNFTMTFTPGPNLICDIERWLEPAEEGWELLDGHIGITGTVPYVFTTPVIDKGPLTKEFFHVWYEPIYTPFVTPPSGP